MDESEKRIRVKALESRLRLEDFAVRWFAVAAPYVNEEDKTGWKAADLLKFLRAEIDPHFLRGRKLSMSPHVPDSEDPSLADWEGLEWTPLLSEPDLNIRRFTKHWSSMGSLLHIDPRDSFDNAKALRQIEVANTFCDSL